MTPTQTSKTQKAGRMGRFEYSDKLELPKQVIFTFQKGYEEMNKLLQRDSYPGGRPADLINHSPGQTESSIYQIKDTAVIITGHKKLNGTFLFISNRDSAKREQTLKLLEEVFE